MTAFKASVSVFEVKGDKAMYLSSIVFYDTYAEAEKAFKIHNCSKFKTFVLEKHKDGSGAIVLLQDKPVQPGQVKYKGNK